MTDWLIVAEVAALERVSREIERLKCWHLDQPLDHEEESYNDAIAHALAVIEEGIERAKGEKP
ncbi:MAG: hypothetical protein GEU73_06020 [Chloroflexi bacterium]|nr:hypothetical protein [Chloroflexota bacterium]